MVVKLVIEGRRATLGLPLPQSLLGVVAKMEGQRKWLKGGGFSFEATHWNLDLFRKAYPGAEIEDGREAASLFSPTAVGQEGPRLDRPAYSPKTPPFGSFQQKALDKCLADAYAALFMEQGTGKSWVGVQVAGTRWTAGEITGVLIIAFNGVHEQWIEEAFPDHLGEVVPWRGFAFRSSKPVPDYMLQRDKLAVFTINFESVFTKAGRAAIEAFLNAHGGNVLAICDESQRIKNPDAKSSIEIVDVGHYCKFRMILTGTPIAKLLLDVWSQFLFLDAKVFGLKYKATFNAHYSVMGRFKNVIGSKNEDRFWETIAPWTFRVTKAEALDLPPKVYDRFTFELHPETRKVYNKMRDEFLVQFDKGKIATVKTALVALLRLQQITCGYLALDKDDPDEATEFMILPNARMDAWKQVRASRIGKVVTWARFTKDIEALMGASNRAVSYYGGTKRDEKIENKLAFINDADVTDMLSNPAAGGTGVDGLQIARTAIYYSHSHNSIHRWQSEDRIDRIGMGAGNSTYVDLVARGTVDPAILYNVKRKKDLADFTLDNIRKLFEEGMKA